MRIDILGNAEYLLAREFTARLGQPLITLIFPLLIALAVFAIFPQLWTYARFVALALVLATAAGWLLLINLHYNIAATLVLVDPTGQLPPGRYTIPVWVENEKFCFWTLILGLLAVIGRRRLRVFQTALNITFAGAIKGKISARMLAMRLGSLAVPFSKGLAGTKPVIKFFKKSQNSSLVL